MTPIRLASQALLAATAGVVLAACGPSNPSNTPVTTASNATGNPSSQQSAASTRPPVQGDQRKILIRISGQLFRATLDDSAGSRDLVAQLPLMLEMTDHGGVEKTGALPSPPSLEGQPAGADPTLLSLGTTPRGRPRRVLR